MNGINIEVHEKEIKKIKRLQNDWGVITTEKEIVMTVYGTER